MLTIMAIVARNKGWEIKNINLKIKKIMTENTNRKIKQLIFDIFLPKDLSNTERNFLINAANECPVTKSLSPSISLIFNWHSQNQ